MIKKIVCEYFGVTEAEMMLKTRKVEFCRPRQVCMYFYKNYTKYSLSKIALLIGEKDHATVLHSCKVVNNLIDTEKIFALKIDAIDNQIKKAIEAEKQRVNNLKNTMETAILILRDSLIDQRQQLSLAEKRNLDENAPAKKMRDLGIKNLKGFISDIEEAILVLEHESQKQIEISMFKNTFSALIN